MISSFHRRCETGISGTPDPLLEKRIIKKRILPGCSGTQCISGMSTVLRDGSFRLWQQSECLHWGKPMRILMAVPCGADASMLRNASGQKMRCRAGGMQIKCTACAAGTIDALPKEGNNPGCRSVAAAGERSASAEFFHSREDEPIRFPVKVRKDCIRQHADPSSRNWKICCGLPRRV